MTSAVADFNLGMSLPFNLQGLLADLGVQPLQIRCRSRSALVSRRGEDLGGALQQFVFPLRDLIGVHVKALGQLRQRLFALKRCQRHFGLEGGRVVAAGSFHLPCSFSCGSRRRLEQKLHLSDCPISWNHLCLPARRPEPNAARTPDCGCGGCAAQMPSSSPSTTPFR